jgi:hypothetical protein
MIFPFVRYPEVLRFAVIDRLLEIARYPRPPRVAADGISRDLSLDY